MMKANFQRSSHRERLIEHLFVGELLKFAWLRNINGLEIARPEVDDLGYDLIVELGVVTRHIQLKTSVGKAARQTVHVALGKKASGCVLWIKLNAETLDLGPFLFFGGEPGEPLPDMSNLKTARRTTPNSKGDKPERNHHRVVPKASFRSLSSSEEVFEALFGVHADDQEQP